MGVIRAEPVRVTDWAAKSVGAAWRAFDLQLATFAGLLSREPRPGAPVPERVPWVDGLENPAESFHNIAAWLVQEGFTDEEIGKVLGGNILRALDAIWV